MLPPSRTLKSENYLGFFMSKKKKGKIDPVEKVKTIEAILSCELGIREAGWKLGVSYQSILVWRERYKADGPAALLESSHNQVYSRELKMQVVNEYLSGSLSQYELIGKYHLRSRHQVQNWVRAYNSSGDLKSRDSGGGSYMKKARTTTPVERLKIVQDCLDNKRIMAPWH